MIALSPEARAAAALAALDVAFERLEAVEPMPKAFPRGLMPWHRYRKIAYHPAYEATGHRCAYCGIDLLRDFETCFLAGLDHVIPKRAGGSGADNLVAACYVCNALKGGALTTSLDQARRLLERRRAAHVACYHQVARLFRL